MKPSFFAAPYFVAASVFAAAASVSAAPVDVTYTLTNQTFTGFNFIEAYAAGTNFLTLNGVSINVTLDASTAYTYADDLCVYVAPAPLALGGLLQCGGFSNLNAAQRYSWPNGFSNAPGTTSVGTVNFTTGIDMSANPTQVIWIGNGYGAAGTSGTWTGTITLHYGFPGCTIDTDLDGRPDCNDNCINIANSNQLNTDGDTRGDACDNCPLLANSSQSDCNNNGVGDACEIAAGATDYNQDTIPDTCQCLADLVIDHEVNGADLGALLAFWGPVNPAAPSADINRDGNVDGADLGYLLYAWGTCVTIPSWATLVESTPDPTVVTDVTLRAAISASGLAWRVRDTATQIEMLLVPQGTFVMGCMASNQYGCLSNENPRHSVTLTQAFYIGRYEVTQSQWVAKMGSNPSSFQGASYPDAANRPVEEVSWNTVEGYLSAGMRLPSEAEWEYACRAGTTTAFNNGSSDDATVGNFAWYYGNSGSETHAVGGKAANALGLYDMSGNVSEWVNDWYDGGYYSVSPSTNPLGPVLMSTRVPRGGGWGSNTGEVRSSNRGGYPPFIPFNNVGFRVARNP